MNSSALRKYILFCAVLSWLLVIRSHWYDGEDKEIIIDDPSFGVPATDGIAKHNPNNNQVRYTPMHKLSNSHAINLDITIPNNITHKGKESMVEALQPVTSNDCCIPAIFKHSHTPKDVPCYGTCYNERACTDINYPFNSAEEMDMFPLVEPSPDGLKQLKKECKSPSNMVPPMQWCQKKSYKDEKYGVPAHLVDGIPPAGCSHFTQYIYRAFQHVIVFPKHKLAFCGIPKVGITQWEQFLRFYIGAKDYPALPHFKLDRNFFQFDKLDPDTQRQIWEDDEWTWSAFVRNPAERLLSAYLDKVRARRSRVLGPDGKPLPFNEFVESLASRVNYTDCNDNKGGFRGLGWCSDPHWRPQVYSCGISERIDRMNFIGDLHNVAEQTRELLSRVGMWESHGMHFINGGVKVGSDPWCNIVSHLYNHTVHVGFQQKDKISNSSAGQTVYQHAKGSKDKINKFYTPELLRKVEEELYPDDYKLWKLVNANGEKLSRGKDLMPKLSSKCTQTYNTDII